jgi:hypothetical protein
MSKTSALCDRKVDAFVSAVNESPREAMFREQIPETCRLSGTDWPETFDWQIVPSKGADWLPDVERQFPFRLPPSFRSLIARYTFPLFVAGPITFYSIGNLGSEEYRSAIFDAFMWPFLLKEGLVPFARPEDGSYDPVCFNYRDSSRKSEPAVVRVDHEEILCNERLRIVGTLAKSFDALLEETTRKLRSTPKVRD